jgi:hypothetical protein
MCGRVSARVLFCYGEIGVFDLGRTLFEQNSKHAKKTNLFLYCCVGVWLAEARGINDCFFTKRERSKDDDYERTLATDGDFARIVYSAQ